jgi:hypothetical protein
MIMKLRNQPYAPKWEQEEIKNQFFKTRKGSSSVGVYRIEANGKLNCPQNSWYRPTPTKIHSVIPDIKHGNRWNKICSKYKE